jgi:hypothetical protein
MLLFFWDVGKNSIDSNFKIAWEFDFFVSLQTDFKCFFALKFCMREDYVRVGIDLKVTLIFKKPSCKELNEEKV